MFSSKYSVQFLKSNKNSLIIKILKNFFHSLCHSRLWIVVCLYINKKHHKRRNNRFHSLGFEFKSFVIGEYKKHKKKKKLILRQHNFLSIFWSFEVFILGQKWENFSHKINDVFGICWHWLVFREPYLNDKWIGW